MDPSRVQPARRSRSLALSDRIPVQRCKHAQLGRGLERHGAGMLVPRRRTGGLEHQRARATRSHSRSPRVLELARGKQLQPVSDSRVTVHIVSNRTSRSPRLLSHLRTIRALCEARGITLSTRHLPSVLNLWADRLSRRTDSTNWGLSRTSILLLTRRSRAQLFDGEGLPPPGAGARGLPPLILPRHTLLPVWHRHLQRLGRGYLASPAWAGQPWYQNALPCARIERLDLQTTPPLQSVIVHYGPRRPHRTPIVAGWSYRKGNPLRKVRL
jgi:hypothetical protein